MSKEIEIIRSQIPNDVLKTLRTDDVRVLKKIAKSFSMQEEKQSERQRKISSTSSSEKLVKVLKNGIKKGEAEIRTYGATETVSRLLLETKTAVSIICPDFETESVGGHFVYKSGGIIKSGIGLTGQRLVNSLPLINNISDILGGLDLFVIYQASAEEIIGKQDKINIRKSADAMKDIISKNGNSFVPHFFVMDVDNFVDEARKMSASIDLSEKEVFNLSRDRNEIIRMRLGILQNQPLEFDVKKSEAAFDIATHLLSEDIAGNLIGRRDFVHFSVDSARFSKYYKNPAISVGRNLHYKGD